LFVTIFGVGGTKRNTMITADLTNYNQAGMILRNLKNYNMTMNATTPQNVSRTCVVLLVCSKRPPVGWPGAIGYIWILLRRWTY
jgi:hypothetical protein